MDTFWLEELETAPTYGLIPCVPALGSNPKHSEVRRLAEELKHDSARRLEELDELAEVGYETFMRPYIDLENRHRTIM